MSNGNHTRERDAESGKYVSEEYAQEHPSTTVSESTKKPEVWTLLTQLSQNGGAIVRDIDLDEAEVAQAKAEGRHWGSFVYVPIEE